MSCLDRRQVRVGQIVYFAANDGYKPDAQARDLRGQSQDRGRLVWSVGTD